ncbi:S-layer homology domain-containing protein [Paenibacillus peoriae]|uniref:S-layer homology domain-containing protein n=1 Tax=Paenibacillus peoriae TaxID=59893 RepID=A0A7H0YF04_9BACL|nr:S-layer homology domain-containing protein [Paenibacillus peoriae]QNR69662.1 S-layer homology domain-containing protein [Paenibacillus peoriae]
MLKKKWLITPLVATTLFFGQSAFAANTFSDVEGTKYEWAAESIRSMVDKGVVKGYADGTFKPSKTITKAEFVHMFHKLFPEIDHSSGKPSDFVDARKHWANKDFAAIFNGDYVWPYAESVGGKYPNYQFYVKPDKPLTRWDVMMIASLRTDYTNQTLHPEIEEVISAAAQYKDMKVRQANYNDNFSAYYPVLYIDKTGEEYSYDGDSQDQKAEAFYTLTKMGVLTANEGYLLPKALVTRAEAVTILQRLNEATTKSVDDRH